MHNSENTDPKVLGIMQGFPPPSEKLSKHADGSMWQFPQLRWTLSHIRNLVPTTNIWRGTGPITTLIRKERSDLDGVSLTTMDGKTMTWAESLAWNYTDGIVILHKGNIVFEKYFGALDDHTPHLAMSITKSFVGIIAASLIDSGELNENAQVTQYIPELKNTVYGDATVRQVLDMTIAVKYSEKYDDSNAEVWGYARAAGTMARRADYAGPDNIYDFLLSLKTKDGAHGQAFAYKTPNAEVVSWLIQKITNHSTATLISERIWQKIGAEQDAYLSVDSNGIAMAGGGLNACLRDLARFGEMLRLNGKWNGLQIVPSSVVADIKKGADPEHFAKGGYFTLQNWSYRNQFWVAPSHQGEFAMRGIHGQAVWVDQASEVVIARFASNPVAANTANDPVSLPAYRAICKYLKG
jgi:CubicO group peptidase (beta-lactamase class C family)